MVQEKNSILVTWDFSEKSECALEHAFLAAKRIKHEIGIIHIVKNESSNPEIGAIIENNSRKDFRFKLQHYRIL